ncbi:MAG: glycosyltransferase [Candidatus Helarchaeota archaeon]
MTQKDKMPNQKNKMKEDELVSIIIPVKDGEKFIKLCLDSIFNQTYKNLEVILIDGRSKDKTLDFASQYNIKIVKQRSKGVSAARNEGIAVANGKYIAWCDVDDYFAPNKIELQKNFLDRHPEVGVVYTDLIFIEGAEQKFGQVARNVSYEYFLQRKKNPIATSSVMMRKEILKNVRFNPKLKIGEDFDIYIRLSKITNYGLISKPLTFVRRHSGSLTRDQLSSAKYGEIVLYLNGIINRWEFCYRLFIQAIIYFGAKFFRQLGKKFQFIDKFIKKFKN